LRRVKIKLARLAGILIVLNVVLLTIPIDVHKSNLRNGGVYEMSIDKGQLRDLIREVLHHLDPEIPYSENAVELLMLTCAQESHLGSYIKQIKGPARGIFQMEPTTEHDLYSNFMAGKPKLLEKVQLLTYPADAPDDLLANLAYQIAMARVHYFRSPKAIPKDLQGWAELWKSHYNTHLGKGKVEEAITNYNRMC
jgi:hypothetical protein